ncbi:MAG: hypothetical protein R2752_15115 [Vicinamibacterales bacterium]
MTSGLLVTAVVAASSSGQGHPDFSGRWHVVRPDSRGTPTYGDAFVATQTDATLTLQLTIGDLSYAAPYRLDGTESNYEPRAGARLAAVAHWDNSTLVVVTRAMHPVHPQEVTRRLRLDASGRLHVETAFSTSDETTTTVYQREEGNDVRP